MKIQEFFDRDTYTLTYLVFDETSGDAVIIDPVLNFEQASGSINFSSLNTLKEFVSDRKLNVHYILETHAHADHLSSSYYLKEHYPNAKVAIAETITEVQKVFKPVFNKPEDFPVDGSQFDVLFKDEEVIQAGNLSFKVIFTPGHTPACSSFLFEDAVFTGDSLFMPDFGTGRCDFPAGSADDLYNSISNKLYKLPDETRVFVGHDYQPGGRQLKFESSIGEEKKSNIHLKAETPRNEYVEMRSSRDKTLKAPVLLLPSIQVNIDAGKLPKSDRGDRLQLNIPLKIK